MRKRKGLPKKEPTVGERIKAARTQRGLSQEELGELLSVYRVVISDWERSKTMPTIKSVRRIARALDCRMVELVGER